MRCIFCGDDHDYLYDCMEDLNTGYNKDDLNDPDEADEVEEGDTDVGYD